MSAILFGFANSIASVGIEANAETSLIPLVPSDAIWHPRFANFVRISGGLKMPPPNPGKRLQGGLGGLGGLVLTHLRIGIGNFRLA